MYTGLPWAAASPATMELISKPSWEPAQRLSVAKHAQHVQEFLPGRVLRGVVGVTDGKDKPSSTGT